MTEIQEHRIKRDAMIVAALQVRPAERYEDIAARFRVSRDVVIRVAKQNGLTRRGTAV
jgi:hypothetical protein